VSESGDAVQPSVLTYLPHFTRWRSDTHSSLPAVYAVVVIQFLFRNGNLTLALAGWWRRLWAGSGCGGSGRAPGWCGWAVASLLRRFCGGAVCWRPAISLPAQSVVVGEVGRSVGMRWRAGGGVGVLRTGPVAAGVRVYSSVSHL
jgi:hypothetical protein